MTNSKKPVIFALIISLLVLVMPVRANALDMLGGGRLSGMNRYETSASISNAGWADSADTAIITTGNDFPDALAAAPLAKKYNAPILLTPPNSLDLSVNTELSRLKVKKVFIIGGTGAVSTNVEAQLKAKGIACTRLSGKDRYETSVAVANAVGVSGKLVVATGQDYPDALSIASWAASSGAPIILTQYKSIPAATAAYLKNNAGKITTTYVIGGDGVVSNAVMSKLKNPKRVAGKDRFATNLAVLNTFKSDFDFQNLYIATGSDFPDALSGSALAAQNRSAIVLSDTNPMPNTKSFINGISGTLKNVYILGGTGVVSDTVVSNLASPILSKIDVSIPTASLYVKQQVKASVNITMIPANAAKPAVTFTAEDPTVISVDGSGTITALKSGSTNLDVSAGGKTTVVPIVVNDGRVIVIDPGHGGWSSGAIAVDGTPEKILNLEIADKLKAKLQAQGYTVVMTRDDDSYVSLQDRVKIANDIKADMFISIHNNASAATVSGTETCYSLYRPSIDTQGVYVVAGSSGANVYDVSGNAIGKLAAGQKATYVKEDEKGIYITYNNTTGIVSIDDVMVYDSTPSTVALNSAALAQKIDDEIGSLGTVGWERSIKDYNDYVTRYTNCVSVLVEAGFVTNSSDYAKISNSSFQDQIAGKITDSVVWYFSNHN